MATYANDGGQSNVASYDLEPDAIAVFFHDGSRYYYTYESAGMTVVEQMKALAQVGQGLNAYINRRARKLYASKR